MAVPTIWLFFVNAFVGDGALNTCPSPLSLRDISPHCGESPDVPKLVFRQTQGLPKAAPTNVSNHNVNAYLLYTSSIIFFDQCIRRRAGAICTDFQSHSAAL